MPGIIAQNGPLCLPPKAESPAFVYLAGLSPGSRRVQREALARMAEWIGFSSPFETPWYALSAALCDTLRDRARGRYAPATARRYMAALRGVIKASWRLGLLSADEQSRLLSISPIRGTRTPAGRALSIEEIDKLHRAGTCKDHAILALLLWGGLRRSEAACLSQANVVIEYTQTGDARGAAQAHTPIGGGRVAALTVRVFGKGGKERLVRLAGPPAQHLAAWIHDTGRQAGATVLGMSPTGIWKAVRRLGRKAGVSFTPHDLRRTYASLALEITDLATVQQAMGHADPRTTAQYDRRGEAAQRQAAEGLASIADLCYNGAKETT